MVQPRKRTGKAATAAKVTHLKTKQRAKSGEVSGPVMEFVKGRQGIPTSADEIAEACGITRQQAMGVMASQKAKYDILIQSRGVYVFMGLRGAAGAANSMEFAKGQLDTSVSLEEPTFPEFQEMSMQARDEFTKRLRSVAKVWTEKGATMSLSAETGRRMNDAANVLRRALGIPYEEF